MNSQKPDIKELIEHILINPNKKHTEKKFVIGNHSSEYGDTERDSEEKEHKLWTPFIKRGTYRCFLIIQFKDEILTINYVLDHPKYLLENKPYYNYLKFGPPSTYAAKLGTEKQFKGSIEIYLDKLGDKKAGVEIIKEMIIDITDETVLKKLNLDKRKKL
jgi:hypothetical protein